MKRPQLIKRNNENSNNNNEDHYEGGARPSSHATRGSMRLAFDMMTTTSMRWGESTQDWNGSRHEEVCFRQHRRYEVSATRLQEVPDLSTVFDLRVHVSTAGCIYLQYLRATWVRCTPTYSYVGYPYLDETRRAFGY